eukprot:1667852-Alexandrium_andersonii.AAC.1
MAEHELQVGVCRPVRARASRPAGLPRIAEGGAVLLRQRLGLLRIEEGALQLAGLLHRPVALR